MEANARPVALGWPCAYSPVCLILLSALSETPVSPLSENAAAGIGVSVLLILVAAAVGIFIYCDARTKPYEYLKKEVFETAYGVDGMVQERQKEQLRERVLAYQIIGVVLCILGSVPLLVAAALGKEDLFILAMVCVLLVMVSCGVACFVLAGMRTGSYDRLLQQGDYSRAKKKNHLAQSIAAIYWPVMTAAYLGYSFITQDWSRSWIIWPVAGVAFAAVSAICEALQAGGSVKQAAPGAVC